MQKVDRDGTNSIYSVEWRHRGYVAFLNPSPMAWDNGDGTITSDTYLVCRPNEDIACGGVHTLKDARDFIKEELG